jgi:hypothetical protein
VLSPAVLENFGDLLDFEKDSSVVHGVDLRKKKKGKGQIGRLRDSRFDGDSGHSRPEKE